MYLSLSSEQATLREVTRSFLEKECPESLVREMERDERGYSPAMYAKMASLGWTGLTIAKEYDGVGLGLLDLVVLLEEFGRALVPGPYISTIVHTATAIAFGGTEEQKQRYLPKIASGELLGSFAYTEAGARFAPDGVALTATLVGDRYILDGTKLFVENAVVADLLIVVARSGADPDSLTLFLVDPTTIGITVTAMETLASDKQSKIVFESVEVSADSVLGLVGAGASVLEEVRNWATVAECAYLVGLADQDTAITVDYIKHRVQFGRPIGGFQALQHRAADMSMDVDACRLITYRAASAVDLGDADAGYRASVAKGFVSDAARRVVAAGQQLHGGIGFTREYKIQLFFRRQKAAEVRWGDSDFHRQVVADRLAI